MRRSEISPKQTTLVGRRIGIVKSLFKKLLTETFERKLRVTINPIKISLHDDTANLPLTIFGA